MNYNLTPQMRQDALLPEQGRRQEKIGGIPIHYPPISKSAKTGSLPWVRGGFFDPRTKLRKERVLARLGQGGCDRAILRSLGLAIIHELQINPEIFLLQKGNGGLELVLALA